MNDTPAARRQRRFWITLSELVGVLALVIAGLNFWDSHREHTVAEKRQALEAVQAERTAAARSSFVLAGQPSGDGAGLALQPLNSDQAIQTQTYVFPDAILDHPVQVTAARPQIELNWIAHGLKAALAEARRAKRAGGEGEADAPVGVLTTYVEDGEVRADRSVYRIGYSYHGRLIGGPRLRLEGLSLLRRAVKGDLHTQVQAVWRVEQPKG